MASHEMAQPSGLTVKTPKPSPYEQIKQAIADGELAPGAPLVETALAEWCQVSRTPVREALTRLEQDGLVIRSSRGMVVRERSHEEVLDIYEVRIVLEGTAARLAAGRRTAVDLIHMRRIADSMDKVTVDDKHSMASSNHEFHRILWKASHNESLIDLLTRLDFHIARYPATTLTQPGRWEQTLVEHRQLIDAVEAGDSARAETIARAHFAEARSIRLSLLASDEMLEG